jgi:hypothetical protein
VSLGRMLRYNAGVTAADCGDPRGPAHTRATLDRIAQCMLPHPPEGTRSARPAVPRAADRVERLLAECHLARLEDLAVPPDRWAAEAATYPRLHDNPRRLDVAALTAIISAPSASEERCL